MKFLKLYFLLILCSFIFTLNAASQYSIKEYTIAGKKYISLYDIAVNSDIQQNFDVISQRGKLYYKHHVAVFQSGFSVFLIDGKIYKSSYPVIREDGEVFIPSLFYVKTTEAFYPDYALQKRGNTYILAKRTAPQPPDPELPDIEPVTPVKDRITFIIIDPGHGGKDPGAIGGKVYEKELVLKISRKLRDHLKQKLPGVTIRMTRDSDIFIELGKRTEIANRMLKKDSNGLFISMHINASVSSKSSGYETYVLSQNPTNEEARATASLENNVVVLEKKKHKPYQDVEYIEALMLTTQIQNESRLLADKIQARMKQNMKQFRSRGVKKADFFVLRGALMPAVLVEAGYITNEKERGELVKASYQTTIARAVGDGVVDFVNEYNNNLSSK
jgi:N-acetylmuramoyl-L-alanine amidase